MKLTRREFITILGAAGLAGCAHVPVVGKEKDTFTFAAINDTHVLDLRSTDIVQRAVQQINEDERISAILVLGDLATSGKLSELSLARQCLNNLKRPFFTIPGNHDVNMKAGDIYHNYTMVFEKSQWKEDHNGWLFIGLNSCHGSDSNVSIPEERVAWLRKLAEKTSTSRPIVLCSHHPFNPHTRSYRVKNADAVLDIFSGHNLKLVAAGHYHGNQVEEQNGVLFTTTACCSSTRNNFDGTRAKGYRLFHVKGDQIETEFVEVPSA